MIIHYPPAERRWAEWLAVEFESCSLDVALRRTDRIDPFRGFVRHTPDAEHVQLAPTWTGQPPRAVVDIASDRVPVAIVLVKPPPAGVRVHDFALDLSDADDEETARAAVWEHFDLRPGDGPPTAGLFGLERPGFPPDLSPVWGIGPRRASRDSLDLLERELAANGTDEIVRVAIGGPPGSGRSTLAAHYAHRNADRYAGCVAIDAALPETLPLQLRTVMKPRGVLQEDVDVWLLVIHNLADLAQQPELPPGRWHVLMTCEEPVANSSPIPCVILSADGTSPAPILSSTAHSLLQLLSAFAPAPIPLTLLAAGAAAAPGDLAEVLDSPQRTSELVTELCTAGIVRRTPETVRVRPSMRPQINDRSTGHAAAVTALALPVLLHDGSHPEDWLVAVPHLVRCLDVPIEQPRHATLREYVDAWEDGRPQPVPMAAAIEVASGVLSEMDAPELVLRLAERGAQQTAEPGKTSEMARIRSLTVLAGSLLDNRRPHEALNTVLEAERIATAEIDPDSGSDRELPYSPAYLSHMKALVLAALGEHDEALETLRMMRRMAGVGGPQLPADDRAIRRLHAELLLHAGHTAEAADVLDFGFRDDPNDDFEAGLIRLTQAKILLNSDPATARELAADARRILIEHGRRREAVDARLVESGAAMRLDATAQAADLVDDALLEARELDDEHLISEALRHSAECRVASGDDLGAYERFDEAAAQADRRSLDARHRIQLDHHFAKLLLRTKRLDRAAELLTRSVAGWRDDPDRIRPLDRYNIAEMLAAVEHARGRMDAAAEALKLALDSIDPAEADAAEAEGRTRLGLAQLLLAAHRPAESEAVAQRIPDGWAGRAEHAADIAQLRLARVEALHAEGRTADAQQATDQCVDEAAQLLGWADTRLGDILATVVDTLLRVNEIEQAHRYALAGLTLARNVTGDASPQIAVALDNLARTLVARGEAAQAVGIAEAATRIAIQCYGWNHREVAVRMFNLADTYGHLGRWCEAADLLTQVVEIDQRAYGPQHSEVELDRRALAKAKAMCQGA
ncbi:hypothetical protein GCM10009557_00700 [Virgisporangium ochraceum]|uniref:Tetratricopeptide repeat protein n=2 Tax=Virgisporangium ochraceum TaxID=65505 RepID=A0A8J4A1K8_9ACTN|nr:hypothetical protein Voc01_090190 [Virgisporangium ochraceum]